MKNETENVSDVNIIDRLLLELMDAMELRPRDMEHSDSTVCRNAIKRLRSAWEDGELEMTRVWVNYFENPPNIAVESAEQQARDMLERLGHPDAQSLTSGDVTELANLIARYKRASLGSLVPVEHNSRVGSVESATESVGE